MSTNLIPQCDRSLDFAPRAPWPRALPAMCWKEWLITGFERTEGPVLDLGGEGVSLGEALFACYPQLGLAELARLDESLARLAPCSRTPLFNEYGLRLSDRLESTLKALREVPKEFQDFVDEKKMGARDLAPLLALVSKAELGEFFRALGKSTLSKSQAAQLLENAVELHLLGANEEIARRENETDAAYVTRLEKKRKPVSAERDEAWRAQVRTWPWPAQVQGQWQRFGDQTGIEIRLRATSPQDLSKKLKSLNSIQEKWSCSST